MGKLIRPLWLLSWLLFSSISPLFAAQQAAVSSAHPLATQAGLAILTKGGNAFDAAVAVSAALAVVEPAGSGLGGGGFWLLHQASNNKTIMIDGRETAPGLAHRDMYLDADGKADPKLSLNGPLAAGIPGLPAALDHISQHYGQLTLAQSLAPAISYARDGFTISEHYQKLAQFRVGALQASPAASAIFFDDQQVPELGFLLVQNDLANTLEQLANHGRAGFYQGTIADKLVKGVQASGGIWQHSDLSSYKVVEREPVVSEYRGYTIHSAALPSSGGIVLATILNQLANLPMSDTSVAQRQHFIVEAMRRAYWDRSRYLGDSDFVSIPKWLTTPTYGKQLAKTINPSKATKSTAIIDVSSKGEDTSHFSIVDQYGNRVAATLSINYPFGSGFVAPGTGVLLNDEMDDFSAQVGVSNGYGLTGNEANAIAPFKRPLSSMSPSFVENDDKLMVIGTPGGSRIITMVLLGILDFVDGQAAQAIVSRPRFHHQYLPDYVQLESEGFDQAAQQSFSDYGHDIKVLSRQYGDMQLIIQDKKTNQFDVASDPRGEGSSEVLTLDVDR